MKESGYYAPGTEFRNDAPWNERTQKEVPCKVSVTQTLVKNLEVSTTNYYVSKDPEYGIEYDFSDVDWEDEYLKEHMELTDILDACTDFLLSYIHKNANQTVSIKRAKELLDELQGWSCVESVIDEE